ncbi:MAG: aminotransferase class I/II-fold pyridoxal phosphate-dependent enzyme [Lachnospiraceae bacterium]|nr:aminotransferase class I/II-fold pyridoxal phosphate-dependent enzyme [Lachnospiraceae bacterium]
MYSFNNDYSEGAHPRILDAIVRANLEQNNGYSQDAHTAHAIRLIHCEIQDNTADIHIIPGGTQTNLLVISSALRPHQAVIAAETGHINVHETGAIEATGHKVLAVASPDGKLTPDLVKQVLDAHTDEHMVQPKMVYISNTTEIGTQYNLAELAALSRFCKEHHLYLFMDGARMGAALTSPANDLTLAMIAELTDIFYIGGTKNGALCGEALVILNPALKEDFRFSIKQKGAMFAKGFLLGIQFKELFTDNLFYDLARHSNQMAAILRRGIEECGYAFDSESVSNQLFPILPDSILPKLSEEFLFSVQKKADNSHTVIRLVTSWATREEEAYRFVRLLKSLS